MQYKDMKNVVILEHPLIQHKISMLRDKATGTNEFRKLVEEIAVLEGYEALRDLPLEDVEGALSVSDAEGRLLEKERDEALHRCLAKLPTQYREVLELTWFEEFSNEQVASILGKSAKQVYNLRARAKETLKTMLEKEGITREDLS